MPKQLRYIAYGSNLHPLRLACRTPSARLAGTVELHGWALKFNKLSHRDGSGKCHIVPTGEDDDRVHAAVYTLSADEKPVLDQIEGLFHGYSEHRIHTEAYGEAFVYIGEPHAVAKPVKPFDWYRELVLVGARYHRFPPDYLETIQKTPATVDPDEARCRHNLDLLETISGSSPDGL